MMCKIKTFCAHEFVTHLGQNIEKKKKTSNACSHCYFYGTSQDSDCSFSLGWSSFDPYRFFYIFYFYFLLLLAPLLFLLPWGGKEKQANGPLEANQTSVQASGMVEVATEMARDLDDWWFTNKKFASLAWSRCLHELACPDEASILWSKHQKGFHLFQPSAAFVALSFLKLTATRPVYRIVDDDRFELTWCKNAWGAWPVPAFGAPNSKYQVLE